MVSLKLVKLPRKVRAFPRADSAGKGGRGGPLNRPAERLLLLGSNRDECLPVLVVAGEGAGGSIHLGEAVGQRVASLCGACIEAGHSAPQGAVGSQRRQVPSALPCQILFRPDPEPAGVGRGTGVRKRQFEQQVQNLPGCSKGERAKVHVHRLHATRIHTDDSGHWCDPQMVRGDVLAAAMRAPST